MTAAGSSSSAGRFARAGANRRKSETGETPTRGRTARRTDPVRITVDLTPEDYRTMRRVVGELAEDTDIPTLPHTRMWRALLNEVADDPALRERIADRITDEQE